MKILVKRVAKKEKYTIGKMYVDDVYVCDTIEDKDRDLTQNTPLNDIKKKKVYGQTAIPSGTYNVTLDVVSTKFVQKPYFKELCGGKLPRLMNVPGFDGVLIHTGNDEDDSYGCIIVGYNKVKGKVIESRKAFEKLYPILKQASNKKEKITIQIG
jgi:hypothetical protein